MAIKGRLIFGGLALLVWLAMSGCQHDSGAPGTYHMGRLEAMLEASPQHVLAASKAASSDLHLTEVATAQNESGGSLTAKTADEQRIRVTVDAQNNQVTRVIIIVGALGDESISRQVLEKIRSNLSAPTRASSML